MIVFSIHLLHISSLHSYTNSPLRELEQGLGWVLCTAQSRPSFGSSRRTYYYWIYYYYNDYYIMMIIILFYSCLYGLVQYFPNKLISKISSCYEQGFDAQIDINKQNITIYNHYEYHCIKNISKVALLIIGILIYQCWV